MRSEKLILAIFLLCTVISHKGIAQDEVYYDEISVYFSVPRIGGADLPALISDENIYLSVIDVLDFLKIKNSYTAGFDSVTGFFITENANYEIDRVNNRITYLGKEYPIKPGDLVRTETSLYLRINYFGEIFGLECEFNFRSLSVTLNTKIELPVIREMRQEQMRKSLGKITGEIEADTTIGRKYPLFHFGMADWSAVLSQEIGGKKDARLALTLGSVIAGGEANVTLNYNTSGTFSEKNQYYQWRYANNDHKAIRQVLLGKISTEAISTLTSPVIGLRVTNTPTTYRQSFGTYTLSDVTEPGWLVELYVNNVLVDYKKADASGFFTFEVPMVYGNTDVKLQFYGPWGEERSKEQSLNIPYNFLPSGTFEYNVTAGIVEDTLLSRFTRANFDYGITRFMTLGGGVEYLSSISSGKVMPFVNTSLRLTPGLMISGEYTHGVNVKGILNWRLKKGIQFEINYTKYDKDQKAINTNYLEERKITFTAPIRFAKGSLFTRIGVNQIVMPYTKYTTAELLLSGSLFGVNTNLTTYATLSDLSGTTVYSTLALSVRLPWSFILTPQTQFNYSLGKFVFLRCGLEKRLFQNGYMTLSYEKNFTNNLTNMEIGLRYDFSFAQIGLSARRSSGVMTFVENASGSLIADPRTRLLTATRRASVGKGGMTLTPFIDLNWNGLHDKDEPKAQGLQAQVSGGRTEYSERDTITRIFDLEPYAEYLVTLDGSKFDNISWQMKHKTLSVVVDPNQFKRINIPILVMGEASGMVYMESARGAQKGQGRILLNFYRNDSTFVSSTMSESDGYFSFLGLGPGEYIATVDALQMNKLNMTASPAYIPFTIYPSLDGDLISDLEFIIREQQPADTVSGQDSLTVTAITTTTSVAPGETASIKPVIAKSGDTTPPATTLQPKIATPPVKVTPPVTVAKPDTVSPQQNVVPQQKVVSRDTVTPPVTVATPDTITPPQTGTPQQKITLRDTVARPVTFTQTAKTVSQEQTLPAEKVVSTEKPVQEKKIVPTRITPDQETTTSVQKLKGVVYRLQFIVFNKPLKEYSIFDKLMKTLPELTIQESFEADGRYHYVSQPFGSRAEALRVMKKVNQAGCGDCIITVYENGVRKQ